MRSISFVLNRVINILISVIQIIMGVSILLQLFGAREVPFVRFVYALEAPLLAPFKGIFQPIHLNALYVLDTSALFALIIYSLLGFLLLKLVGIRDFK
ncbi:MAG TPA: YggT family protein [Candidatus Angelobacter sp.]|nr:YggT family protein [Candidatus Angelobacter sp.]